MNSKELVARIMELEDQISDKQDELTRLKYERDKRESRQKITALSIKRAEIFNDRSVDFWFGHISALKNHLVANNVMLPYCTWNGMIYATSDIKMGYLPNKNLGYFEDVSA